MSKKEEKKQVPFFARYLESQELEKVTGGKRGTTNKHKDDLVAVTLKYPSDSEDTGGDLVTLKYPSDSDEDSTTI